LCVSEPLLTHMLDRMVPADHLAVERVEVFLGQADDDEGEDCDQHSSCSVKPAPRQGLLDESMLSSLSTSPPFDCKSWITPALCAADASFLNLTMTDVSGDDPGRDGCGDADRSCCWT